MTNKQRIDDIIDHLHETQRHEMAGWRWLLFQMCIKLLELAKRERINDPGHNPRSLFHLRELITPEWHHDLD